MRVRVGLIGGGLMGKELASALGRWHALKDFPVKVELVGVADIVPEARDWFRCVPSVKYFEEDYRDLLTRDDVDVIYAAVPHNLHKEVYLDVLKMGKDLLAEKPFGMDLDDALAIEAKASSSGRFVRCSSEFPFLPGALRAFKYAKEGGFGRLLQVNSGFWHASDLDFHKPANWKRKSAFCGEIGVMGDLGMHALHLPLRLGLTPTSLYAQLQKGPPQRPDGKGGMSPCDTWDNAQLHCTVTTEDGPAPMRIEMKRLAPGATNTWYFELLGSDGGVRFSTSDPKALFTFQRRKEQSWSRVDLGYEMDFPTITGGIFEAGFPDCFLQMWASYIAERGGFLDGRMGCVTPAEAVASHRILAAALKSQEHQTVEKL